MNDIGIAIAALTCNDICVALELCQTLSLFACTYVFPVAGDVFGGKVVRFASCEMPVVLSDAEKKAALEKGSSELRFLLERNNVDNDLQAMLFHTGVVSLPVLATIATSASELKDLVRDEFGVDSTKGLVERVKVANLLVAWENATVRSKKQSEIEGELSTKHLIKPMSSADYINMRQTWEARFWMLDDEFVPARSYLEKRADEMEQDDLKAEPLTSVITKGQDDQDVLIPVWSNTGAMTMRKGSGSIEEPKNPEQLRKRLKVLSLGLMFLGMAHTNRKYLQNLNPQLFEDYVTYLLSDHCFYLQGRSAEGFAIAGPSWAQLLIYEFQIRKKMWQLVQNNGYEVKDALRLAWQDPVVKERYFTTPIALSTSAGSKRQWDAGHGGPGGGKKTKGAKGSGGSGKGKGKGKGKSAAEKLNISSRTPDGEAICFGYNDFHTRCRNKGCRFKHVCGICFGKHPSYACTPANKAAAPETQGGGRGKE